MIRQLVTENYRPQVETAMTDSAFIVGDPVSDMVPLDGAVEEARMVKARLSKKGFKVTSLQREEATPPGNDYRVIQSGRLPDPAPGRAWCVSVWGA